MAEIDKGLVLRLEATTLLLSKQLQAASGEVEQFATKSTRAITVSSAQQQNAVKNLGFQFNDFLVQVQGGTPVLRAFAQQSGQAAGALADMGGKAGVAGRFFSGILGGSILSVGTILASYLLTMDDTNEALDLAKVGSNGLADAQSVLGDVFDLTSGKIKSQNELLIANARLTALNLRKEASQSRLSSTKAFGNAGEISAFPFFYTPGSNAQQFSVIDAFRNGKLPAGDALKQLAGLPDRGLKVSNTDLQQAIIDSLAASEKDKIANLIEQSLDSGTLAPGLRRPGRTPRDKKTSDADAFAQSMGFASAKAYQDAIQRARDEMEARDLTLNPFAAVTSGSRKFEQEIGETVSKAREGLMGLSVATVDVTTATMDLFKELEREGDNVDQALNDIAAGGLESLGDGIADAIMGAQSLGEAFSNVANQIIADLVRIAVRQALIKPLAGAIGGVGFSSILGFADGGDPPVGQPFLVGERGPEIMRTKVPTTVIPNHKIGRFMGDGGSPISISIDARGASDPAMVRREAEQAIWNAAPLIVAAARGQTMADLSRPMLPSSAG